MSRELFGDVCLLIGVAGVMEFTVALCVLLFWRAITGESMHEPRDNRDETVPASDERHEIRDPADDSTPPASPNSGPPAPIDFDAYE